MLPLSLALTVLYSTFRVSRIWFNRSGEAEKSFIFTCTIRCLDFVFFQNICLHFHLSFQTIKILVTSKEQTHNRSFAFVVTISYIYLRKKIRVLRTILKLIAGIQDFVQLFSLSVFVNTFSRMRTLVTRQAGEQHKYVNIYRSFAILFGYAASK